MKTILRILAIVLVITAVAGATYALGQSDWVTQQLGFTEGRGRGEARLDDDDDGFRQPGGAFERGERSEFGGGFGDRDRDGRGGVNLLAITGFVRTLLPMALVIAVVVSLSLSAQWVRRWRKEQA
ncbi:MAG: hypothetical protein WAS33_13350, partial [Candidatus Promineifilaceae bacterium]